VWSRSFRFVHDLPERARCGEDQGQPQQRRRREERVSGSDGNSGEARRHRASPGRYFEDFAVGDVYEHRPGRTVSEADNTWFTLLTMNQHPLHFDHEYARHSEFGRPVVNSTSSA
jgi:acyl dehydratase